MNTTRNAEDLYKDPADIGKNDGTEKFLDEPVRTNDAAAIKKKAISDKVRALQEENDLREVLATQAGIRVLARIIGGPCGWNMPYFHPSNSVMSETAGRRSIAKQLEDMICDVDFQAWIRVRAQLEEIRPKPKTSEKR